MTTSTELSAEDLGRVHLIGVGGVGMSGLARLLLTRGIRVSGSELKEWPLLGGLRALGGTIHMRHDPSNLDGVDTVVYSTAIPADHLELVEARARGLRVLHRRGARRMTGRARSPSPVRTERPRPRRWSPILQHCGLDRHSSSAASLEKVGSNAPRHRRTLRGPMNDNSFLRYRAPWPS